MPTALVTPLPPVKEQPEAASKIQTALIIGAGLAEATAIYGLIVAIMVMSK